jgi:hypothetical protein
MMLARSTVNSKHDQAGYWSNHIHMQEKVSHYYFI